MEGYGSDAGFQEYVTAKGLPAPSSGIAAARLRGSLYIDAAYGDRFSGRPVSAEQVLGWPRQDAADRYGNALSATGIPVRVEWAAYEAALAELSSSGSLSPTVTAGAPVKRQKVDVIEIEYAVGDGSLTQPNLRPVLPVVEGLLAPLLVSTRMPAALVV